MMRVAIDRLNSVAEVEKGGRFDLKYRGYANGKFCFYFLTNYFNTESSLLW